MFEIKRSEGLKVKIYGAEYTLRKPSVKMIEDFSSGIDDAPTGEKFDRAKFLLTSMGLEAKVIDDMELDHLNQLIGFITETMTDAAKKN